MQNITITNVCYSGGVTDVKGDVPLRPSTTEKTPDMYLRVGEVKDTKGSWWRGAKIHQTGSLCAHWGLVVPTREMREADKRLRGLFFVSVIYRGRASCLRTRHAGIRAMEDCDLGNVEFSKFRSDGHFRRCFYPLGAGLSLR